MSARSFFDSNVVLYLTSLDLTKSARARTLIDGGGTISVQVLNEITNVAREKARRSWSDTRLFVTTVRSLLHVQPLTLDVYEIGLRVAERYNLHIYDAMIAAAALEADCDTLWTEDMHDGLLIDGKLRVTDPFRIGT
jgi:predicted nucleic acid-binding protein